MKRFFSLMAAVCLLLCSCTTKDSAAGSGTGTGTETGTAQTAASGETAEPAAQTSASQPDVQMDTPLMVELMFPKGGSVALTGTGFVFARSGLNLRSQPTANSQKLALLKHGTTVKLKNAVCANMSKKHIPECWYQVEANGQNGFVSAEFVAAAFDAPLNDLDDTQRAALGILLYRQAYKLYNYFFLEGGISATAKLENKATEDGWLPLEPKGLTIDSLLRDYAKYFASDFPYPIEDCYREQGGTLYVKETFPENFYVDYDELTELNAVTDSTMTYKAVGHWFTTGEFVMITENNGITEEKFVLQYTDGCWKIAGFTPIL